MYMTFECISMVQKNISLGISCVCKYSVWGYSCIPVSVLLEMCPFDITHSRSEIEWSSVQLLVVICCCQTFFCDCSYGVDRRLTYVVA